MTIDPRDPLDVALDWLLEVQQRPEDGLLRERLAAWLASDERHLVAYRQAERAWQVSGLIAPAAQPAPAAYASPAPMPARPRRRARRLLQACATMAACCTVALLVQSFYPSWQADVHTANGERRQLQLPDGSQLTLNAQSAVALDFTGGKREVRVLEGQAYFEVRKDAQHPFRVHTDELSVTVTGTAFSVDSARQRVNVAEGHVRVGAPGAAEVSLDPGAGVVLDQGGALQAHDEPAGQVAAWRQGRLILRQERIADVLDALRPYCRDLLVLRDSALGEQRITGVYDLAAPEKALRAIVQLHGGELRRMGPVLLIGRAK